MEIREALTKADEALSSEPAPAAEVQEAAPVEVERQEVAARDSEPASRVRDEKGRFARTESDEPQKAPEGATAGEKPAAQAQAPTAEGQEAATATPPVAASPAAEPVKPPQSWKPAAREAFAKAPPEVQQEVIRRETEINRAMQETADARRFRESMHSLIAPHMPVVQQLYGGDPGRAIDGMFRTVSALTSSPPRQRAAILADMVRGFGVSVEDLASALDGQPAPQQAPQVQPPDVEALVDRKLQAIQQQAVQRQAAQTVEQFAAKHEFFEDVRDDMSVIVQRAAERGIAMSMDDAYNRALRMNPEVWAIFEQRQKAATVANANASTQRSKAAAASVRASPAAANASAPKGIRAAMEQAAKDVGL